VQISAEDEGRLLDRRGTAVAAHDQAALMVPTGDDATGVVRSTALSWLVLLLAARTCLAARLGNAALLLRLTPKIVDAYPFTTDGPMVLPTARTEQTTTFDRLSHPLLLDERRFSVHDLAFLSPTVSSRYLYSSSPAIPTHGRTQEQRRGRGSTSGERQ
jgi:hypothetical protein